MRSSILLWVALLVLGLPGCLATSGQIKDLEGRLVTLEKAHAGFLLTAERETKRLQNLAGDVEQSNAQLRESVARSGAKLSDFETNLQKLGGQVEVLAHRLSTIEKTGGGAADQIAEVRRRLEQLVADLRDRAGIAILALPAELPPDADGFAKLADAKLSQGDVRAAAAVASECQKRFAGTEPAGQCGLVLARIAIQEQRYADATRILQAVHDGLGGRAVPVVGAALLDISRVLELQGRCANAQKVLKYIVSDMPKLAAAKAAKELLAKSAARCKEGQGTQGAPPQEGKPAGPTDGAAPEEAKPPGAAEPDPTGADPAKSGAAPTEPEAASPAPGGDAEVPGSPKADKAKGSKPKTPAPKPSK